MKLVMEILLDEEQVKQKGLGIVALSEELRYQVAGTLDMMSHPRWPKDAVLDYEVSVEVQP